MRPQRHPEECEHNGQNKTPEFQTSATIATAAVPFKQIPRAGNDARASPTDRKLFFDVEEQGRMRSHAKTRRREDAKGRRRKGEKRTGRVKTMGQAIYFSPLTPLRLSVLSNAGVRNL